TMASSMDPVTQSLLGSQSAPNVALTEYEVVERSGMKRRHKLVYGKDRATGGDVEGFGDAIRNMEF
nr:hypothetical protein [Tanacetum cinerariifolium]